jgi:hypothetical protein
MCCSLLNLSQDVPPDTFWWIYCARRASFQDRYEEAVVAMIQSKRAAMPQTAPKSEISGGPNVINLMEALKRSLAAEAPTPPPATKTKKRRKKIKGQREMLLTISGNAPPKGTPEKAEPRLERRKHPLAERPDSARLPACAISTASPAARTRFAGYSRSGAILRAICRYSRRFSPTPWRRWFGLLRIASENFR